MAKRSSKAAKRPRMKPKRLRLERVGPIVEADVEFGDLTVLVGPQASGKSVFLQTLKLAVDRAAIRGRLREFNQDWSERPADLFQLFYGEGMGGLWTRASRLEVDGAALDPASLARGPAGGGAQAFYLPAQRVVSLRGGSPRPFSDYQPGDPFVLRSFSQDVHELLGETRGGRHGPTQLFPKARRLQAPLQERVASTIMAGFRLELETEGLRRRLVLVDPDSGARLPYLVWSAGQREFVPLLLGLYWLAPPSARRRGETRWVILEEPEMGLHPDAITAVMALVLDLLHRGYRVCISTHSSVVLDVVWAIRVFQRERGRPGDLLDVLGLRGARMHAMAETVLRGRQRVYFFERGRPVKDISALDPSSEDPDVSYWGRITGHEGDAGDVVSRVVNRNWRAGG